MIEANIIETADGLYQAPINLRAELALISLLAAAVLAIATILGKPQLIVLLAWVLFVLLAACARYRQYKRYGPMGRPSVSTANGVLYIDQPHSSDGGISIQIAKLQRVVVYGQDGRRIIRLVRTNDTVIEVIPQWRKTLEQRAIAFLVTALPGLTRVEAPQSMFAAVRGDGPQAEA